MFKLRIDTNKKKTWQSLISPSVQSKLFRKDIHSRKYKSVSQAPTLTYVHNYE